MGVEIYHYSPGFGLGYIHPKRQAVFLPHLVNHQRNRSPTGRSLSRIAFPTEKATSLRKQSGRVETWYTLEKPIDFRTFLQRCFGGKKWPFGWVVSEHTPWFFSHGWNNKRLKIWENLKQQAFFRRFVPPNIVGSPEHQLFEKESTSFEPACFGFLC